MKWFEEHRFVTLSISMIIIFLIIMTFLYMKADEITRDPCSICAEKHGKDVYCTLQRGIPITKTYLPNGTYYDNREDMRKIVQEEVSKLKPDFEFNISRIVSDLESKP